MNKKKIIIIIVVVFLLLIIPMVPFTPKPCSHINFAWLKTKSECICLGIEIDTSCKGPSGQPCADAGEETSCLGVVVAKRCYEFVKWNEQGEADWNQVSCSK